VARAGGEDWRSVSPTRLRARLLNDPGDDGSRAEMARRFPPPWSAEESDACFHHPRRQPAGGSPTSIARDEPGRRAAGLAQSAPTQLNAFGP
jgi:hypothetical protein